MLQVKEPGWSGLLHMVLGPEAKLFKIMNLPETKPVKPLPTLKKRAQFLALRHAPRFSCEDFVLQGYLGNSANTGAEKTERPRVGYTVTKKIGNSVERNRIRRRLRQALGEAMANPDKYNAPHGNITGEVVVVARRSAIDQNYGRLVSNFIKGIDRIAAKGNKAV